MTYVNVCVSRRLKEEMAWVIDKWLWVIDKWLWVIDKWLWVISNNMLFKTVVPLRN